MAKQQKLSKDYGLDDDRDQEKARSYVAYADRVRESLRDLNDPKKPDELLLYLAFWHRCAEKCIVVYNLPLELWRKVLLVLSKVYGGWDEEFDFITDVLVLYIDSHPETQIDPRTFLRFQSLYHGEIEKEPSSRTEYRSQPSPTVVAIVQEALFACKRLQLHAIKRGATFLLPKLNDKDRAIADYIDKHPGKTATEINTALKTLGVDTAQAVYRKLKYYGYRNLGPPTYGYVGPNYTEPDSD